MPSSRQRGFYKGVNMKQEDELALKVTKEIVIKFIEIGRLSVNSFDEVIHLGLLLFFSLASQGTVN